MASCDIEYVGVPPILTSSQPTAIASQMRSTQPRWVRFPYSMTRAAWHRPLPCRSLTRAGCITCTTRALYRHATGVQTVRPVRTWHACLLSCRVRGNHSNLGDATRGVGFNVHPQPFHSSDSPPMRTEVWVSELGVHEETRIQHTPRTTVSHGCTNTEVVLSLKA